MGIFSVFKRGLQKTATSVSRSITTLFTGEKKWDASMFEELEYALISADFGVKASGEVVKELKDSYDLGKIAVAALYHDGTEVYTGDMPTPVKYNTPELRQSYALIEEQAALTLLSHLPEDLREDYAPLLREDLPEDLHQIVKAADKLAAYIKCVEEVKFGNNEFIDAKKTTYASLKARNIPELDIFLEEFLPAFELTLDEMQN